MVGDMMDDVACQKMKSMNDVCFFCTSMCPYINE